MQSAKCLGGGTGRRAGFKIQFFRECGFDSHPRYLKNHPYLRMVFYFPKADKSHKIGLRHGVVLNRILKLFTMNTLANLQKDFIENVSGYSSLGIVLSTCLGALAILASLSLSTGINSMLLVLLSVIICSVHNAAILTLQKPILIFRLLIASLLVNTIIILGFLIF